MSARLIANIFGVLLVVIGAVWTLQGANVLQGSVMTGQSLWLYIGIACIVVGAVVLARPLLRRR